MNNEWVKTHVAFIRTQYHKAPKLQKVFIWIQMVSGISLVVFSLSQISRIAVDMDAELAYPLIKYQEMTQQVLQGRNTLFGIAFAVFGLAAILYENIYEMFVGVMMMLVFEALAAYEFASDESIPGDVTGVTIFALSTVVTVLDVVFVGVIYRRLGRNSSLLFYSAGSNAAHRAAYTIFLKFNAVLKMDLFIAIDFYVNIMFYLFGAGNDIAFCAVSSSSCHNPDCPDHPPYVASILKGCNFPSSVQGQVILTMCMMVTVVYSWFCLLAIRRELKVMAGALIVFGVAAPVAGIYAAVTRYSFCCDTPFVVSLVGFCASRITFLVSMVRCTLRFDQGLLHVFNKRSLLRRGTPGSLDLRLSTSDFSVVDEIVDMSTVDQSVGLTHNPNVSSLGGSIYRGGTAALAHSYAGADIPASRDVSTSGISLQGLPERKTVVGQQVRVSEIGTERESQAEANMLEELGYTALDTASEMECAVCSRPMRAGASGWWKRGVGVMHTACAITRSARANSVSK